ncbi:MAG: hypothetical protein KAU58_01055 [Candidatus Omnitrophica bacterium]|nr:hypothetical protein [Candidatus Omnitrophota bacterium]
MTKIDVVDDLLEVCEATLKTLGERLIGQRVMGQFKQSATINRAKQATGRKQNENYTRKSFRKDQGK